MKGHEGSNRNECRHVRGATTRCHGVNAMRSLLPAAALLALVSLASRSDAQERPGQRPAPPQVPAGAAAAAASVGMNEQVAMAVEQSMNAHMDGPHLDLTPLRKLAPGDSARAAKVVAELRSGIAKYRDLTLAIADGFHMFAPEARDQPIYHYIHPTRTMRENARFDPTRPSSLLYRKRADGSLDLLGAMYTAAARATHDDLDARIPLSVAQWHRHINYCFPTDGRRISETRNGQPLFGPVGTIATRAECESAGGRFTPQLFGWMVHANVFAGDDPKAIWGSGHGHEHPPE